MNVTVNNRFLPLNESEKKVPTEALIKHRKRFEPTPTFDRLNTLNFWLWFYQVWSRAEMMEQARVLKLRTWPTMGTKMLQLQLATYWIKRVEDMSRGQR